MLDEEPASGAERRVRAVLQPTRDRAAAIARRALAQRAPSTVRRHAPWVAIAAVAVLIVGAIVWRGWRPAEPALHIWGSGSLVVVTRDDGRRWLVDGERQPAPRGQYVIVVPQ